MTPETKTAIQTTIIQEGIKIVITKIGDATVVLVGPDPRDLRILKIADHTQIGRRAKIVFK